MANTIDANGLILKTNDELFLELTNGMKDIYGDDINVASDTPDGQLVGIFTTAVQDVQSLLLDAYTSFDPDQATGVSLDSRGAYNGVKRQAGAFTLTPFSVTVDRSVNLVGLDAAIADEAGTGFTISDSIGNKFILTTSTTISTAGTTVLSARSQFIGAIATVPNTLTTIVTPQLGVKAVNNPTSYSSIGSAAELDLAYRERRKKSVALTAIGYFDALTAQLLNVDGITFAKVYENNTPSVSVEGILPNGIWCIVEGGTNADVAQAIYRKRNLGVPMKGSEQVTVTRADGSLFDINFDRTATQSLYISCSATSISGVTVDTTTLKSSLVSNLSFDVYASFNVNQLAEALLAINPDVLTTNLGVSTNGTTFTSIVTPQAKNYRFSLQASNITITVV